MEVVVGLEAVDLLHLPFPVGIVVAFHEVADDVGLLDVVGLVVILELQTGCSPGHQHLKNWMMK